MIRSGQPIPIELQPPSAEIVNSFMRLIFDNPAALAEGQEFFKYAQNSWVCSNDTNKLQVFRRLHNLLFAEFFPEPNCRVTFNRVTYAASFHSDDWSTRFSGNYFSQRSLDYVTQVWIHETYHACLHFLSHRYNSTLSSRVIRVPNWIENLAKTHPLAEDHISLPAIILAEKNLAGMTDRHLAYNGDHSTHGWDSYYLNVEMIVEELAEVSYKYIDNSKPYRRGYCRPEEYISKRLNGIPPQIAHRNY